MMLPVLIPAVIKVTVVAFLLNYAFVVLGKRRGQFNRAP